MKPPTDEKAIQNVAWTKEKCLGVTVAELDEHNDVKAIEVEAQTDMKNE